MEARRLTQTRTEPWLAPFSDWLAGSDPRAGGRLDLECLNEMAEARRLALESGRPVRFVDAAQADDSPYELGIAASGRVPTRVSGDGMVHDWFNALCWLRWPAIKARMNRLQAEAIRARPESLAGRRGALRDAVTLFDESGALFVSDDDDALDRWRRFDWTGLFVARRDAFAGGVRVLVVGHALLEKLQAPYKAICAQALAVRRPAGGLPGALAGDRSHAPSVASLGAPDAPDALDELDDLDARVAASLDAQALSRESLRPLPLLGIPGWWPGNADPAFYNDGSVFRPDRRRSSRR
ncbi:DUF3025 domain-containing protein [Burkholderiaceae bacterium FT117]|uniref:DUF3025 domain-containing protein n=1 Tax=Zeimonas sediminis TaxID=2944268 RepID=UPI0023431EAC|nr:DUF3025 domain-containing protein [Zeimonas sediminis]MCM5570794.1 DUF3025 domain-containing protein [Zeimonas sediminis]